MSDCVCKGFEDGRIIFAELVCDRCDRIIGVKA